MPGYQASLVCTAAASRCTTWSSRSPEITCVRAACVCGCRRARTSACVCTCRQAAPRYRGTGPSRPAHSCVQTCEWMREDRRLKSQRHARGKVRRRGASGAPPCHTCTHARTDSDGSTRRTHLDHLEVGGVLLTWLACFACASVHACVHASVCACARACACVRGCTQPVVDPPLDVRRLILQIPGHHASLVCVATMPV